MLDCKEWRRAMSGVYGQFAGAGCIDSRGVVSVSLLDGKFVHDSGKVKVSISQGSVLECLNRYASLSGEESKIERIDMDGVCSFGEDLFESLASSYISDGYRTVVCRSEYHLPKSLRTGSPFREPRNAYPKIAEASVRVCRVWEEVYNKKFDISDTKMRKYAYNVCPKGIPNLVDGVAVSRTDMSSDGFLWLSGDEDRELKDAVSYLLYVGGSMDGDIIKNITIIPNGGVHTMQLNYNNNDEAETLLLY